MDPILAFFSDLILFTAGLAVASLWLFILIAVGIEIHDFLKSLKNGSDGTNPEGDY